MLTLAAAQAKVVSGVRFFGQAPHGEMLARYVPFGPVFHWVGNRMVELPVQGSDLCWWLAVAAEEHETGLPDG